MNDLFALLVPILGQVLLDFVWQGLVIGLLAAVALELLRGARPQARYLVACLSLLACALVPMTGLIAKLLAATRTDPAIASLAPVAHVASVGVQSLVPALATWRSETILPAIVAVWAVGALTLSLRMALGVWWVRQLTVAPAGVDATAWQARLDALAQRMRLTCPVQLRLVRTAGSPASMGWLRPVVLLPCALVARMPVELVEALLAHELAHVRRHDYLVNLLQGAVEATLFYHPVTWWLSRCIRVEREVIADQIAAGTIGAPRRLAVALSELATCLASDRSGSTLALAANGGHLMSRIEQLVQPHSRRSGGRIAFPLIGLAAACLAFYAQAQIPRDVVAPPQASTQSTARETQARDGYVMNLDGKTLYTLSDASGLTRTDGRNLPGGSLLFRKNGKAYVISDATTLSRVADAWAGTQALERQMDALDQQMKVHQQNLDRLDKQMDQLGASRETDAAMEAASAKLEAASDQQAALSAEHARLAARMESANATEREQVAREMAVVASRQQALSEQMRAQSEQLEQHGKRLEAQMRPMEDLGRRMEAASKPMEALGKQMDALGQQMSKLSKEADRQTWRLIDEATAKGLATPATMQR